MIATLANWVFGAGIAGLCAAMIAHILNLGSEFARAVGQAMAKSSSADPSLSSRYRGRLDRRFLGAGCFHVEGADAQTQRRGGWREAQGTGAKKVRLPGGP